MQLMKKPLSLLLSVLLIISVFTITPLSASAESVQIFARKWVQAVNETGDYFSFTDLYQNFIICRGNPNFDEANFNIDDTSNVYNRTGDISLGSYNEIRLNSWNDGSGHLNCFMSSNAGAQGDGKIYLSTNGDGVNFNTDGVTWYAYTWETFTADHFDSVASTCDAEGNYEYYTVGDRYFKPIEGTTDGHQNVEQVDQADTVISATGHSWDASNVDWTTSGDTVTASFHCANDGCTEVYTVTGDGITVDTSTPGHIVYTASFEDNGQTYTASYDVGDAVVRHSLTLDGSGDLGLNFYMPAGVTGASCVYKDETVTQSGNKVQVRVAAAEMTQPITVTYTVNGVEKTDTYSVVEYANMILSGNYADNLKSLVKAMLNYGAAAQQQFSVDTDNLANEGVNEPAAALTADELSAIPDGVSDKAAVNATLTDTGVEYYGCSLLLYSETTLRCYFRITDAGKFNADSISFGGVSGATIMNANFAYIDITGIAAAELDDSYTLSVGTVTVGTFSALSYVKAVLCNAGSYDSTLIDAVTALYRYNEAANAFFNA